MPHEELQYLRLVKKVLESGVAKMDRTGTGTLSTFGETMRWSLKDNVLPLLTTKKVFWKGIVEELLWFIKGDTNAKHLSEKGVHIWDNNATRSYLDSVGLKNNEEGDLGPVYGFQWRHFGATYTGMNADYTNQGVDQLENVIHELRTNPTSRRIIMSAWNPADIKQMALPPCHSFIQFHVSNFSLSTLMYQRSGDIGLGIPFNIASYALLTHMVAHILDYSVGEFVHVIGDAHIYLNHREALEKQVLRTPNTFPTIRFKRKITNINDFTSSDIILEDYKPHAKIDMGMSV